MSFSWSSRSRTIARKLVNCEKTRTLCPSSTTSAIEGRSMSSLALGSAARLGVDQAGVAGGLAEPQQRLEDLDLGPVQLGGVLAQQGVAVVGPQLVVAAPLLGLHVAVERLLGLLGQVLDDLLPWCGGG